VATAPRHRRLQRWARRFPRRDRRRSRAHRDRGRRRSNRHRDRRRTLGPMKGIDINGLLANVKRAISGSYPAIRQGKYDRRKSLFGTRACIWQKPLTDLPIPLLGQPPVPPARDAAATGARDDAVQTASRADLAHGEQFSWLRMSPDQVGGCCFPVGEVGVAVITQRDSTYVSGNVRTTTASGASDLGTPAWSMRMTNSRDPIRYWIT
jgi:hypothetical protein